ncbi:SHOCT domain-containing protein [Microbacterium sp. ARD31]|uniref:SHOCT domain-containing protein n=1 Tax=Microbacterium sp. ARD31 TaxID=2962576 RepID=UPI002881E939|nr:SHOCT domain-containing protein [Microbacterium sp. ARD31]MDT0186833.1 SHOCT domain-containing protein [Microbacterium sp. ARD31]
MWGDYDRMHDGYGFGWFALIVLLVVLVGLAVTLLVVMLRSPGRVLGRGGPDLSPAPAGSSEAALILRRRFAAGEIDEDEFRRRLAALSEPL